MAVDEIGFVQRGYCGLENVVAEVVADGGFLLEAREDTAQNADYGYDGACVTDADGGVAEEEDGFEDRGRREDEVAHWLAVEFATVVLVLTCEF